jgi:23S rRNA (uracil1939-C5)-methyltransferase
MKKSKKYILENVVIQDFAAEGKCIIKNDGEVIFVDGGNVSPGDVVNVLVKKSKKRYSEAIIIETIKYAESRIEPFCKHFGVCGGCKWQQIPYDIQLEQKNKQVIDQLSRIGKVQLNGLENILPSEKTTFYRNKLEYTFSNSKWLTKEEIESDEIITKNAFGFHAPGRFDKVIPIDFCYLQADPSNQIRDFLSEYANKSGLPYYDHIAHQGFFRTVMIRTTTTGEVMVAIQFAQDNMSEIKKLLDSIIENFPNITSLNYFVNTKRNDSYFDLEPKNYYGVPYITEEMEGLKFRIGVKSFYQTNGPQAYNLYKLVRDFASITKNDLVYDLYTGTGTIALFISSLAKKVIGIEYIPEAIEDAKNNASINNISNTDFFAGDMSKILNTEFIEKNGRPNIVIVDPPRAGMDKSVCQMLLTIEPDKIVYVSCNPATQARDIELLSDKYKIEKIRPVDMFPHTFHVENIVSLIKK